MHSLIKLPDVQLSDMLVRLNGRQKHIYALISSSANGWGNLLAWNPVATFTYKSVETQDTVAQLEKFYEEQRKRGRLVVGYITYDFGCALHNVALHTDDDIGMPLVGLASFDNWLTFDKTTATIHSSDSSFIAEVRELADKPTPPTPGKLYNQPLKPLQARSSYNRAYKQVENYIRAGDIYQVNLAHRLEGESTLSGRELFCQLSSTSKSDFQAYIAAGDFEILSFSPERFIRVKNQEIETSPIKGTRPRGATPQEDTALRKDLLTSPKERAELNMITDLMRNDLGKICQVGSVHVTDKRIITGYPTLWHAHATIKGKLRPDINSLSALMSVMPGGSITGCPKKRAMEIIDELEVKRRGIYTGSIFKIEPSSGELDSSITIRTMVKKANHLYLSVGGGIVYDSTEADEYAESINKAASFMDVRS
jgi:para-aminobenzoate synthetase component 1